MSVPSGLRSCEELRTPWESVAAWMAAATGAFLKRPKQGLDPLYFFDNLMSSSAASAHDVVRRVRKVVVEVERIGSRCCNSPLSRLVKDTFSQEMCSSGVRAGQIVRTLYDLVNVLGFKPKIDWTPVILRYWLLDFYCLFIDTLKYHTLWLGNKVKNEVTKRKDTVEGIDGYLVTGGFRRFLLHKLAKKGHWANCISETLQQGLKRGMPSMKNIEIDVQMVDYQLELSRPKPLDHALDWEIRRTARELCGELLPDLATSWPISMSAGYASQRDLMGQRGEVHRFLRAVGRDSSISHLSPVLVGMKSRRYEFEFMFEADAIDYRVVWDIVRTIRHPPILRSRVAVVREPLKIRPITAGPSLMYAQGKPYQQAMWSALQRTPQFQLTGSSVTPVALELLREKLPDEPFNWFISGDYSGATNSMSMLATRAVWQTIWGEEHWHVVERMLDAHLIELERTTFVQKNGQLMGSPLSFPVLCIVNAAVGRRSYELYTGKTLRVSECPMLINGDDFAGRSNPEHYALWKKLVSGIGWNLSPGKSYFSRDFVQINSRTFGVTWAIDRSKPLSSYGLCQRVQAVETHRPFPVFQNFYPFVNFGYLELMSKDVKQLDEMPEDEVATGWQGRVAFMRLCRKTFPLQFKIARRNLELQVKSFSNACNVPNAKFRLDWPPSMGGLFFTDCEACTLQGPCASHGVVAQCQVPTHMLRRPPDVSNLIRLVDKETPLSTLLEEESPIRNFMLSDPWKEPSTSFTTYGELGALTTILPDDFAYLGDVELNQKWSELAEQKLRAIHIAERDAWTSWLIDHE